MTFSIQAWQLAAEDVLSALICERYMEQGSPYFAKAYYDAGVSLYDMPPGQWRTLYVAVADLHVARKAINYQNVLASGAHVSQQWYYTTGALFDDVRETDFDESVRLCKDYGRRALIADVLEQGVTDIRAGAPPQDVVRNVISDISATGGAGVKGETAAATGETLADWLNSEPSPVVSTGLEWLDAEIGGFERNMFYALTAPYKGRKSTMMYNFALRAARAGESVAILSLENLQRKMVANFVAMMAVERLLKKHGDYRADNPLYWISGEALHRARAAYRKWRTPQVEAIDAAIQDWKALANRIRLYDMTESGGLRDKSIANVQQVIMRDQHLYGGWLYMVDHMLLLEPQLMARPYEHQSVVSGALRELTRRSSEAPISILLLAQKNEENIKQGSGYSAGVKGGGSLSADVDVLLELRPVLEVDDKYFDDRIDARVKFNRGGGSTEYNRVGFHPGSGLIMPLRTFDFTALTGSAASDTPR